MLDVALACSFARAAGVTAPVLKLRRGRVVSIEDGQRAGDRALTVELRRRDAAPAIAYPGLTGAVEPGDEVIVNVEARDLGLGSGGFDIVHCNLTRGLVRREAGCAT